MNNTQNDNDIKNLLEQAQIPKELEPEEIAKMLKENSPKKHITHRRTLRIIATLTACLVLGVGIIKLLPNYTNLATDKSTNSPNTVIQKKSDESDTTSSQQNTNSYYKVAGNYSNIYSQIEKPYKKQHNSSSDNWLGNIVESIFGSNEQSTLTNENGINTDGAIMKEDATANEDTGKGGGDTDYSDTLTQVEGVDEADIIKTDGKNIFYTVNNNLYSIPVDSGNISNVNSYSVGDDNSVVQEIYLYNNTVITVSLTYSNDGLMCGNADTSTDCVYSYWVNTVIDTYTVNEDGSLTLQTNYLQNGAYNTSRMIDGVLYLTTNYSSCDYNTIDGEENIERYVPQYSIDGENTCIPADDILIPKDWSNDNYYGIDYLIIAGIDVNSNSSEPVSINAVAGYSGNSYCSKDNLYIANPIYTENSTQTSISKFALDKGNVAAIANGTVDGYVLNQYSMDEYNGNFRIATTVENYPSSLNNKDVYTDTAVAPSRTNNLFILNENLETIGSVTDFGKTESIKSVNFKGDIGYVVTFKQTDPLFAIDLSDPTAPTIMSELKADGYSSYLHNWSDGLLLGFGVDTQADPENGDIVREIGVKLSMFDTSDHSNMNELATYTISADSYETGNVWSEATYNPKALLIDSDKNIIGFPVERYFYGDNNYQNSFEYHLFKYVDGAFSEIGSIPAENFDYFRRGLYIGDYIYILSNEKIYSANLSDMSIISELPLN